MKPKDRASPLVSSGTGALESSAFRGLSQKAKATRAMALMGASTELPLSRVGILCCAALVACVPAAQAVGVRVLPRLSAPQIASLIPATVPARDEWAEDVAAALTENRLSADPQSVCEVLAVIQQESGFDPNPAVPGLARIVRNRLDSYAGKLGPLGPPALHELLKEKAIGHDDTFEQRVARVRTERDVDRIFRDLLAFQRARHPATFAATNILGELFAAKHLEDFNPITTLGSMQVSVRFARQLADQKVRLTDEQLREELYTRRGGVYYGAARLLGYQARYDRPVFRFADYNAGLYSSRNAAVQHAVGRLTGTSLAPDGDLLAYDSNGEPGHEDSHSLQALLDLRARSFPELSEREVRRDALREKERVFEESDTYQSLQRVYQARFHQSLPYAAVPDVTLAGPKIKGTKTTAWYAASVERHFTACMARLP